MTESDSRLIALRQRLKEFVEERDWGKFHDPKNLAMAIASEAGELLSELRWIENSQADTAMRNPETLQRISNEIGDVLITLLLFCERAGIDPLTAAEQKLDINANNYPVVSSKGRSGRPADVDTYQPFARVIAIDWSGEASGGSDTIWLSEVVDGELIRLENGRSREEAITEVIALARHDSNLAVGLDFAFSFPEWFARDRAVSSAFEAWQIAQRDGEKWLRECAAPFWGRPGRQKPDMPQQFRETELDVAHRYACQPKSVFQIGGAGAVGTGSIRGMPQLLRLRQAGFCIWPFDPPGRPLVVEIYPRTLTGPVVKSNEAERAIYLARHFPSLRPDILGKATKSEDAFDAAVSGLTMWSYRQDLGTLRQMENAQIEGVIWTPMATP